MAAYFHITAVFDPAPGKSARLQEVLSNMSRNVHEREPDCHRYLMTTEEGSDNPRLVMIEQYKDKETADGHTKTDWFKEVFAAFENEKLLAKEPLLIHSKSAAGYDLDRKLIG